MLPSQKVHAETLRIELILGLRSVPEVIAWADSVVAADPNPDAELLELATSGKCAPTEVWERLSAVRGECDRILVSRSILGGLRQSLAAEPTRGEAIARSLYELWQRGLLPEKEFGFGPSYLDELFDLAGCGAYETDENAVRQLDEYLARHEAPRPT